MPWPLPAWGNKYLRSCVNRNLTIFLSFLYVSLVAVAIFFAQTDSTVTIRRDYMHYIKKYNRYEKRHKKLSAHMSPAFLDVVLGDQVCITPVSLVRLAFACCVLSTESQFVRDCVDDEALQFSMDMLPTAQTKCRLHSFLTATFVNARSIHRLPSDSAVRSRRLCGSTCSRSERSEVVRSSPSSKRKLSVLTSY
jgi:ribosomal protein S17